MIKKTKKIILSIISVVVLVLLFFFGPALLDRIIGFTDRSTKGTFKENRYTYKLDTKSDILPYNLVLLPDTDISKQYMHAIVSFHYYTLTGQDPIEHRYYEFTDDGSLTLSNNLLLTEMADNNEEDYFICPNSNTNFALFGNYTDTDTEYYYMGYNRKELLPLHSHPYSYEPMAVNNHIYWSEINELDDDRELSHLVRFDPNDDSRINLITRSGSIDLLAADSLYLLFLGLNYEDDFDDEFLYRYNIVTNNLDSLSIAGYGGYIFSGYLADNTAYFLLTYDDYEDEPMLGSVTFGSSDEVRLLPIPTTYQQAKFTRCEIDGGYAMLRYEQENKRSHRSNVYVTLMSLDSGNIVKTLDDFSSIGINNKYLFYVRKELSRTGLLNKAEIVVEELSSFKNTGKE